MRWDKRQARRSSTSDSRRASAMEVRAALLLLLFCTAARPAGAPNPARDTALGCCEGDLLLLLDSSGSVSAYEFSRLLAFVGELLQPFSLGPDQVDIGLLQVGTEPRLEFGLGAHRDQVGLQGALSATKQLQGDTNTVEALRVAQHVLDGARPGLPRVLLWLTDGIQPGPVEGPMAELRRDGVAVLTVSTGRGNYQLMRSVVTPPIGKHLYFVDVDHVGIIAEDLRNAIVEIIRAKRLQVRDVSSHSALLQWRPILSPASGYYEVLYRPEAMGGGTGSLSPGTSPSIGGIQYVKQTLPGDAAQTQLRDLRPDTRYNVTLTPHSNLDLLPPLSVSFRTLPELLSPTVVTVSDLQPRSVALSWGPLQPDSVRSHRVEYSVLSGEGVRVVTTDGKQNSTVLPDLQPSTSYLVTVSALHSSGQERAMSIRLCTPEELPPLADLQLTTVGSDSVRVRWQGAMPGLRGYWVSWEAELQGPATSRYLPPSSETTLLTRLPPGSRVCVSPVYRTARGEGLCCTAHSHSDAASSAYGPPGSS